MQINQLTKQVIGACIEIHKTLGPGLLESAYEECLCRELSLAGIGFERQRPLPVAYKGVQLDCGYRLDLGVEDKLFDESSERGRDNSKVEYHETKPVPQGNP